MESIVQSAAAGLIAALMATVILGFARLVRQWSARRQDVRYIRKLLMDGRKRVMDAEDTFHQGMNATIPGDALRAAQYKNTTKRLRVALKLWAVNLSHDQRKDIFDALDWHYTDSLHAVKRDGQVAFVDLDVSHGRWPTTEMTLQAAKEKFKKLEDIKWLSLSTN